MRQDIYGSGSEMTDPEFRDLASKCIEGTASPEEERAVVEAAAASEARARWLEGEAALDAALRAMPHAPDAFARKILRALRHDDTTDRFARRMRRELEGLRKPGLQRVGRPLARDHDADGRRWSHSTLLRLAVAAATLIVMVAVWAWIGARDRSQTRAPQKSPDLAAKKTVALPVLSGGTPAPVDRPSRDAAVPGEVVPSDRRGVGGSEIGSPRDPRGAVRVSTSPGQDSQRPKGGGSSTSETVKETPAGVTPSPPDDRPSVPPVEDTAQRDSLQTTPDPSMPAPDPVTSDGTSVPDTRSTLPPTVARPPEPGAPIARLEAVAQGVCVFRETNPSTAVRADVGTELRDHDAVHVPRQGHASIRYADRTSLKAGSDTLLELAGLVEEPGSLIPSGKGRRVKKIALVQGTVTVEIPRDPAAIPVVVSTSNARARATAATFTVTALAGSTRLEMLEGRGALIRHEDNHTVDVSEGHHAIAAAGAPMAAMQVQKHKGLLDVSLPVAAAPHVDLTDEGVLDWICWTQAGKAVPVRRVGVPRFIGDVTILGRGKTAPVSGGTRFSWTNGEPAPNGIHASGGLSVGAVHSGFQFVVPAGKTPRTLKVYVGVSESQARLEAFLSDGSAPPVVETSLENTTSKLLSRVYTIRYAAASDRHHLIVSFVKSADRVAAARKDKVKGEERRQPEKRDDRKDDDRIVLQAVSLF